MPSTHPDLGHLPAGKSYTPLTAAIDVEIALRLLEGRWKLVILFQLFGGKVLRFSQLERLVTGISQKVLTQQLRQLEAEGLVLRTVHAKVPPRVEYRLSDWGQQLCPALEGLLGWLQQRPAD
jgi:DNA-binding HxlR family transcriptional regulator